VSKAAADQLFRAMRASVGLVRDLDGLVSEDSLLCLKAAALGQMQAYAELTGLPTPLEILTVEEAEAITAEAAALPA
jgi:hypothetical protein